MFELMAGIRSTLEACKAVKPEERVLIYSDDDGNSVWMGQILMNVVNSMGAKAILTVMNPEHLGGGPGAWEPPEAVAAAMRKVDAIFRVTDKTSLTHSNARKEATAAGVRHYVLHPALADVLKRGISPADLTLIKEHTEDIVQRLTRANEARITTPLGTDITMTLKGREGVALHPMSLVSSLPDYAEAAIAPVEGTAEGTIVADVAIVQWKYRLMQPLHIKVKAGKVIDVTGSKKEAERFAGLIAMDEHSANIAEFGIGTSHLIQWEMHGTRRDAARIGTAHIAIGRNNDIGGKTWSRVHQDALMSNATVELDGERLLLTRGGS